MHSHGVLGIKRIRGVGIIITDPYNFVMLLTRMFRLPLVFQKPRALWRGYCSLRC